MAMSHSHGYRAATRDRPYEALPLEWGQGYLEERLLDRTFRVPPTAFFQVNTAQAEAMAREIIEQLDPSPEDTVVDAYCGVGTFGLLLADRVKRVVGIENSGTATESAAYNARGMANVEFVTGATEKVLPEVTEPGALIILDPPRQGCHPRAIDALAVLRPQRIVYVSCDPSTLARDLGLLTGEGFTLRHVQPLDMFPQTYHVECIALLTDDRIGVARRG